VLGIVLSSFFGGRCLGGLSGPGRFVSSVFFLDAGYGKGFGYSDVRRHHQLRMYYSFLLNTNHSLLYARPGMVRVTSADTITDGPVGEQE
jgi:hypothetical protein